MSLEIVRLLAEGGEGRVLCTVMRVLGSAPRHAGSLMVAGPGGLLAGSVGGGRGEARVLAAAAEGRARVVEIDMQGMDAQGPDMVCGGNSRILLQPASDPAPFRAALERLLRGERVLLATHTATGATAVMASDGTWIHGADPGAPGAARVLETGHPAAPEGEGLFLLPLLPKEKLLILGAGHVGRALASLAPGLGFDTTLGDDRDAFLDPARLPAGVAAARGSFTDIAAAYPFDPATYVVVVSRGHLSDLECVRAILPRPRRYAGFMGSLRKVRLVLNQALADGHDPAQVAALCAPIGLDIDAETPEELAVAIAGELIAVRRGAPALEPIQASRKARRGAP
ncbi:MAG TPA: XdhC family protein [Holophaga sp.]|nr:XdhC family protein [Holophaga sp.]